jgi:phosphoenolpyruvate-protein phosphotransferase
MAPRVVVGVPAAPGVAEGPAARLADGAPAVPRREGADPAVERRRLEAALASARAQLAALRDAVAASAGAAAAEIFAAHAMFLDDPALRALVEAALAGGTNAEAAWADAVAHFAAQLDALPDPTLRGRAADVRDVGARVLALLTGSGAGPLALHAPAVIVADDLAPSVFAALDRPRVLALCLGRSGPTAHAVILARAWGIPAVTGLGDAIRGIRDGDYLLVDGDQGRVVVDPGPAELAAARARRAETARRDRREQAAARDPALTTDGRRVRIEANVGSLEEVADAVRAGAEGIGLLRTEFLFLDRTIPPAEEEQAEAYRAVLDAMGGRPVTARLLDAGGDKPLPYLPTRPEANPALGVRGVRLLLQHPELLRTQLRALVRAGAASELRVMVPMVAAPEELRRVRQALEAAAAEVAAARLPPLGMMVETPAAVLLIDHFVRQAAFVSVGTNDLAQYTMAADRGREELALLHDACHPAVLRQIAQVAAAARRADRPVAVCGELAGDPAAVPLLIGLGVDVLSMVPRAIPRVKATVRQWSAARAETLARRALELESAAAVRALVRSPW